MKKISAKILYFLVSIILFIGCSSDGNSGEERNQPPTEFEVNATASASGLSISLIWTESSDPEGGSITYDIFAESELIVSNIQSTSFSFTADEYDSQINGVVVAKDGLGLERSIPFEVMTSSIVEIPDVNFESALLEQEIDTDGLINGQVNINDVAFLTELDISRREIRSLQGIEAFGSLERLSSVFNPLESIDLTRNSSLKELFVPGCQLSNLDLTNNTNLEVLGCSSNQLTSLNLEQNVNLRIIECFQNRLRSLVIPESSSLLDITCGLNELTELDISLNPNLERLSFPNNDISEIDTSQKTKLRSLFAENNNLVELDLSSSNNLENLAVPGNNLEVLNIKNGNNSNIGLFLAQGNPNLSEICVDEVPPPPIVANNVDLGVSFVVDCN